MTNKEILLSNLEYFEISIGKRVTKKQVYNSKGQIPIYSANVFKPFGYLTTSNLNNFEHDYVLWGIDGNFEFNIKRKGEKFGTTDHCGTIKIMNSNIMPEYILYQLNLKKHELGFDRTLRASLSNMELVTVNIPFTKNDKIDIKKQQEIVLKYNVINNMKNQIALQLSELENAELELDEPIKMKEFLISTLFDFPETNSKITKDFCKDNIGTIPVYGCSKSENVTLGYIKPDLKKVKYYQDCLTWNRNGSVGYFFFRKGMFATNEDHRTLKIKLEFSDKIYPQYLKYILQNLIRKLGYNFSNKLGKEKIKNISIQLPVTNNDELDIIQQKNIANMYEKAYSIKKEIIDNLQTINESVVSI